ncbi:ketosteroid isomerase-related protein [Sphingobium aquiterrae]|uniref:ketosteroid isomerase-related protein n=1 Tax=Sphingobium aquiterrae TaxID=2038656 RepID=UPI00301A7EA0
MSIALLTRYYAAFNAHDSAAMLDLLAQDVVHEPCQGQPRHGRAQFRAFLAHMDDCYREQVIDPALFVSEDGTRGAAEFMLEGAYLKTDGDLPSAKGQRYRLRVGTFFAFAEGQITRVTNHYNLQDWIDQISA